MGKTKKRSKSGGSRSRTIAKKASAKEASTKEASTKETSEAKEASEAKEESEAKFFGPYDFITPILINVFGEQYVSTKVETYENKFNVFLQKKRCLEFSMHKINEIYEIHIDYLDNCKPPDMDVSSTLGSGSHTMRLLIDFARELRKIEGCENTKLVVKIDASKLYIHNTGFPLNTLFILTRGESWYNSLGFREEKYDDNLTKANQYLNSPMEKLAKKFNKIKDITCNGTVKDCFVSIFTRIKLLSKKQTLDPAETTELKYYKELLTTEGKKLGTLFENTKWVNLYYNF